MSYQGKFFGNSVRWKPPKEKLREGPFLPGTRHRKDWLNRLPRLHEEQMTRVYLPELSVQEQLRGIEAKVDLLLPANRQPSLRSVR